MPLWILTCRSSLKVHLKMKKSVFIKSPSCIRMARCRRHVGIRLLPGATRFICERACRVVVICTTRTTHIWTTLLCWKQFANTKNPATNRLQQKSSRRSTRNLKLSLPCLFCKPCIFTNEIRSSHLFLHFAFVNSKEKL